MLNDREQAFEGKYAHDNELNFKIIARRNKLLGLWAAEKLNKKDADAYAKEVVLADFDEVGEDDLFAKLLGDFNAAEIPMDYREIARERDRLFDVAREQVMNKID